MTRPPAFANGFKGTITLGAYAKPSTHRYCTRPLSNLKITVVKQMERVDLFDNTRQNPTEKITTPDPSTIFSEEEDPSIGSFAGCCMNQRAKAQMQTSPKYNKNADQRSRWVSFIKIVKPTM